MKTIKYALFILFILCFHVALGQPAHVVAMYANGKLINYNYLNDSGRLIKNTSPWSHTYDTTHYYYYNNSLKEPFTSNANDESLRRYSDFNYSLGKLSERNIVAPNALLYINGIFDIVTMITLHAGSYSEKRNGNTRIISRTDIESRVRLEPTNLTSFFTPESIFHGYTLELNGDTIANETYYVDDAVITRKYEYENSIIRKIEIKLKYNDDTTYINDKDVVEFIIMK